MARRLASIQKIAKITPIYTNNEIAHSIEQAFVLGWRTIVQKGQFHEGQAVVFFEEDTVFNPADAWVQHYLPFMEKHKWRIKLMELKKMRSVKPNVLPLELVTMDNTLPTISQGVVVPIEALLMAADVCCVPEVIGEDVTDLMGVTKYEPPVRFSMGESAGGFPTWISKTDEPRIQSYPAMLEELNGDAAYATLKFDGSSVTVWFDADGTSHVASRNFERKDGDNVYWRSVRPYLPNMMTVADRYAFQGETYGEGIQKNPLAIKGVAFAVFNVFDRKEHEYLALEDALNLCNALNVPHVPVIYQWDDFNDGLDALERLSRGYYQGTTNHREGIVVRPMRQRFSPSYGGRLSFKYINPDYLLTPE